MKLKRMSTPMACLCALSIGGSLVAQTDDYRRALQALKPDHHYQLDETDLGDPLLDENGDPVPVVGAGGIQYDSFCADTGFAEVLIPGRYEGRFDPAGLDASLGLLGVDGPIGQCGIDESTNRAFGANNAGSINLGPGEEFANDAMTVALWFRAAGSEGGDRVFTNNRPDISDHFQITLGGGANLVIGINPQGSSTADSLQVPASAVNVKDNQWHHIVASRNGPSMSGVLVVIDGVDHTPAMVDSTTGWGTTGTDAHIASRPGGDGDTGSEPRNMNLNGAVDELAVWLGRQLTVGESIDLYNAGATCIPRGKVVRRFSNQGYAAGESVTVSLEITPDETGVTTSIQETVPVDAVVSEISDGGLMVDQTIEWSGLGGFASKSVTYKVSMPPCALDLVYGTSTFTTDIARGRITGESVLQRSRGNESLGSWINVNVGATGGFTDPLGDHQVYVSGTGLGIKQTRDEFRFIHRPAKGGFEISARIDCLSDPASTGQAGLMVRDTLDQFSAGALFFLTMDAGGNGTATLRGIFRRETNSARGQSPIGISQKEVTALPVYMKLKREETKVTFHRSADGTNYTEVATKDIGTGTTQLNVKEDTLVGLAVSGNGTASAQAIFSEVSGPGFKEVKPTFRRGDTDANSALDISDAVKILGFLFLGLGEPECLEAADTDDSGVIDISDAVANLGYQFLGSPPPAAPGPGTCGPDVNPPDFGCKQPCP